ncbi:MAG: glycoside hydrolase family 28 protein [Treponema sp.]|jgi:polygalacturonase|nr:glycoside hydrolase family 28 protein [Treponema sp.]
MMNEYNLSFFGARGDGQTDNSRAFAAALGTLKEAGGGTLRVERGVWRTGPVEIFSRTTLYLEEGAVISFIPEPERYGPVYTRWEGVCCYAMRPCLFSSGQERITVAGKGGFDGNGQVWWDLLREKRRRGQRRPETPAERELARLNQGFENQPGGGGGRNIQFLRPPLAQFLNCRDVRLEDIGLINSPFWTLHPVFCEGLGIKGISIVNPPDAPNTDGIDIDSCGDVKIEGCRISVGDDGIALKSGAGEEGVKVGKPCRNVVVRGCVVENGHGGIVIGSETAGGIFQVLAEDCLFRGTDRGIRVKTRRGRGGEIRDMEFRNITMENNLCPLVINMYYRCGADLSDGFFSPDPLPVNQMTPSIKNIRFSGLRASGCRASAGFIAGLPESPVEHLVMNQCEFSTDEQSGVSPGEADMFLGIPETGEKSFRLLHVRNLECNGVHIQGPAEAFIYR